MILRNLAVRIRGQREKRGLRQQDIANALGISPQAVSKWERGENAPDIAVLAPLAQLLGVTVDWLLAAQEERRDVFEATVVATSVNGAYDRSLGMQPRDFATWANGLFYQLTELTLRYGGVPIKYIGDGYLCFFSGTAHERRAVEAALRARAMTNEDLRLGLSSGPIYLGAVGHPDYARPDVMGEVVNIAFLVMHWAAAHDDVSIAVTDAVAEAAGDLAASGRVEEVSFRDINHPVRVVELTAPVVSA